jgi:hypothetical protein
MKPNGMIMMGMRLIRTQKLLALMPTRKRYEYTTKLHRWQQLSSHELFCNPLV